MRSLAFPLLLLSFASGSLSCRALAQSSGPELPDFTYKNGWMGADAAYSIPLAPRKSLWLFGDSFVGPAEAKLRSEYKTMIRNSVGISHCEPVQRCTLEYFWRKPAATAARSFFDSGKEEVWYWPLDGFVKDRTVYAALLIVRNKPGASPTDAFGFEIAGTKLVTIENTERSPDNWNITMRDLTDGRLWPGVSVVVQDKYAIWYTQVSTGEGKGFMAVMRLPLAKMANPSGNWEYLRKDNQWATGLAGEDSLHVIEQPISEMSVRYHPSIKRWVAVSTGPEFPSPRAVARTADSPTGPWSAPQTIYEFPEMKRENSGYDKDTFCYAVKEHIEFTDAKIAMTYACNSFVLAKTIANMEIYRPRVVILDLPQ